LPDFGYVGAGTAIRPEDAKQQLGRVRYLTRFMIGLDYSNLSDGQTVSAYRAGAIGAAQIESLDLEEWTDFDTYSAGVPPGPPHQHLGRHDTYY
jgi:hypothetical protein